MGMTSVAVQFMDCGTGKKIIRKLDRKQKEVMRYGRANSKDE